MKPLGIVAGLPAEGSCLTHCRLRPGSTTQLANAVRLQLSGIGPERACQSAQALLAHGVTALVSWGSAGGLDPALAAGTLLLPESIIGLHDTHYPTDTPWRERLQVVLGEALPICTYPLIYGQTITESCRQKTLLFTRYRASAVDMESGAIAAVARRAGIPFVVVRAIADPANFTLPRCALRAMDPSGRLQPWQLLGQIARSPRELVQLVRLASAFGAAKTTLATVARLAGARLLAP